eukprot:CAMPEP_0172835356 /NCGR_PEP_ID=MMETSP1075-20121228/25705_1 /TAXON_ID=2916 /ORGANISM="Ceratium fusus, Strain PA161109" /LENGTH=55 /DNA_ID=CAMNT_0013678391 /DNA_START=1 /DNA_END=164 /DNA_ORIENTATION=+
MEYARWTNRTMDQVVASHPDLGFGALTERYYGPGGGKGDTTTKVGAMLSADGRTL